MRHILLIFSLLVLISPVDARFDEGEVDRQESSEETDVQALITYNPEANTLTLNYSSYAQYDFYIDRRVRIKNLDDPPINWSLLPFVAVPWDQQSQPRLFMKPSSLITLDLTRIQNGSLPYNLQAGESYRVVARGCVLQEHAESFVGFEPSVEGGRTRNKDWTCGYMRLFEFTAQHSTLPTIPTLDDANVTFEPETVTAGQIINVTVNASLYTDELRAALLLEERTLASGTCGTQGFCRYRFTANQSDLGKILVVQLKNRKGDILKTFGRQLGENSSLPFQPNVSFDREIHALGNGQTVIANITLTGNTGTNHEVVTRVGSSIFSRQIKSCNPFCAIHIFVTPARFHNQEVQFTVYNKSSNTPQKLGETNPVIFGVYPRPVLSVPESILPEQSVNVRLSLGGISSIAKVRYFIDGVQFGQAVSCLNSPCNHPMTFSESHDGKPLSAVLYYGKTERVFATTSNISLNISRLENGETCTLHMSCESNYCKTHYQSFGSTYKQCASLPASATISIGSSNPRVGVPVDVIVSPLDIQDGDETVLYEVDGNQVAQHTCTTPICVKKVTFPSAGTKQLVVIIKNSQGAEILRGTASVIIAS